MATLENYYVSIRQNLHQQDAYNQDRGRAPRAVPITVRQLEAVIRIAESVAKMRLSEVANESDVQQAIHMFTVSTLEAAKMGEVELEGGERPTPSTTHFHARLHQSVETPTVAEFFTVGLIYCHIVCHATTHNDWRNHVKQSHCNTCHK